MNRLNRSEKIFKVVAYSLIVLFTIWTLYPLIYCLSVSISGRSAVELGEIILLPKQLNFYVYNLLIADNDFWVSYVNTLYYTIFGTMWSLLLSATGAYALSKKKLMFRKQFNFIVVFTMWFSAGMIPLYLNYISMGVDSKLGVVFAFGVQAYNVILLRNYFEAIPKEIEEAAEIDGASEFKIFTRIYLPMSKAALATVTLFYATSRWNGYFWASLLVNNLDEQPVQVYLRNKINTFQQQLGDANPVEYGFAVDSYAYAIIICSIIPILVIYPFIQKYFTRGVSLGGVKE